ncbi:Phosphatidylglycerol/phosphatidylinositol transfer protein [Lobosporangium transversale]|uniref:Phosphatidylglycerol/phosphatidylinositol transfer protein n=1 Tax=Lobosporangium transversale TaxID=64571 RepID=A0A1Y2H594_9FUNG|nr:ML domain-domain-containing protein [Lobosporangium transversale]KAF9896683.1 Phosphatidylglycerol/phosphatidylinositol transfer protein [Lobosporangium transversale]ORZ28212.1 ML domain-domain-containing protein [Lobosporangium transversale]|eukprot:XP_021885897.1 ML domain-domain-containing protein [Lobosporangium transversale]
MRLSTVAFSLACALGLAAAAPFDFAPPPAVIESCGGETDLLTIDYVNLTPNPPLKGQNLTIDAKGFLTEDIVQGAKIDVVVKVGLIKLLTQTFDFCEESVKIDMPCPIVAGDQYVQQTVELPKEIPPGKYTVNIKVRNPDSDGMPGKQVTCLIAKAVFLL